MIKDFPQRISLLHLISVAITLSRLEWSLSACYCLWSYLSVITPALLSLSISSSTSKFRLQAPFGSYLSFLPLCYFSKAPCVLGGMILRLLTIINSLAYVITMANGQGWWKLQYKTEISRLERTSRDSPIVGQSEMETLRWQIWGQQQVLVRCWKAVCLWPPKLPFCSQVEEAPLLVSK